MPAGYRQRVETMIASLQAAPEIEVTRSALEFPATPAKLATAKRFANGPLPDGLEDFCSALNGFTVAWRHIHPAIAKGDDRDTGSINLLPIERIFADWHGTTWFDAVPGSDRFRNVKPFDLFQPEACIAFLQEPGEPPSNHVAYHYFGESLTPTGYGFPAYLERLLASRGTWGWQQTLLLEMTDSDAAEHCRKTIATLFPEVDLSLFRPA